MTASPTAAGRRARFGVLTLVMILAVTASAIIAALIGERTSIRLDATDTGEHRLSPKTAQLLTQLGHDYEIVLAVNHNEVSSLARQRVADVADLITRASPRITITTIDTASDAGLDQFDQLLARLAKRDEDAIKEQTDLVTSGIDALKAEAAYFADSLAPALQRLADAVAPAPQGPDVQKVLNGRADAIRSTTKSMLEAAGSARDTLQSSAVGAAKVPATDRAAAQLAAALNTTAENLNYLHSKIVVPIADADTMPAGARDAARSLATELAGHRDRTARLADSTARLKPLDLQRIAHALESTSAIIVIGPPGVGLSAIDTTALYPPTEQIDLGAGVQADLRRRAEDLFATAVGMLEDPLKPIVVLVHGENQRVIDDPGFFSAIAMRLRLQGIDIVEWPVVLDEKPPSLTAIDPGNNRPVVFAVVSTDASKTFSTDPNLAGPSRAAKLGQIVDALIEQGEPVLLSLDKSTLPSFGQADPMTASLHLFGLQADTARPILHETVQPTGRTVQTDQAVRPDEADHPIYRAIQGLPTAFPWPVAVRQGDAPAGARITRATLYTIPAKDSWGESQWIGLWQVPAAQRPSVIDPPLPDSARDDTAGPWPVVVAATRSTTELPAPARLVVVGSNTWFFNGVANLQTQVYGRIAPVFPGNAELFEAAIQWLAGKDDLIAQTTTARAVPLIRPLSEGQLSLWRWSVVGGLPLLVLLCGLAWRILRG